MKILLYYRIGIYVLLAILIFFCFFSFIRNKNIINEYYNDSKIITGHFSEYIEFSGRVPSDQIWLEEYSNPFIIDNIGKKGFNKTAFKNDMPSLNEIILTIKNEAILNKNTVIFHQVSSRNIKYVDEEVRDNKRKWNSYGALFGAILFTLGMIHHHYKPWI